MATDVELPQLGESVTEGTITAWLVSVGDTVEADQPLFELSSDKIDTEVPSPTGGVVTEILVEVDETVEVGTVVARIGEESEAGSDSDGSSDEGSDDEGSDDEVADEASEEASAEDPESGQEDLHDAGDSAPDGRDDDGGGDGGDGGGGDDGDDGGGSGGDVIDIVLPELGESVTEGTITAWLVSVGDEVTEDQPLFELSSDKIDTEVPSPAAGTVSEILIEVDETVDVGTVVARLGGGAGGGSGSGSASAGSEDEDSATSGDDERVPEDVDTADSGSSPKTPTGSDALASPLVRKMASENDVDLDAIEGSGQGGRITREDVEAAISGDAGKTASKPQKSKSAKSDKPAAPARAAGDRERVEDLSRIRQRIADKMIESQQQAAQLTTVQEADVTALMNARTRHKDAFKSREGVSLSPFAIVARAALMAVRNHPMLNAAADWDNGKLYLRDYVNLGIAVDTPKGLLVPNVKGADGLTVAGLARGIAEAAQKARGEGGRKLDFADIEGGTFTLTNTGSVGVLIDTPILNYPEVAILGVGAIVRRPAVVTAPDGSEAIAIRHMLYLSLTYDHRLLDGADAARFVTEIKHVLEGTDWDQEIG
ncbi:2-oxoglutarate dehydrogenase, E2 component, dihydrolipoamide succinyltransferase [soil metagenome]